MGLPPQSLLPWVVNCPPSCLAVPAATPPNKQFRRPCGRNWCHTTPGGRAQAWSHSHRKKRLFSGRHQCCARWRCSRSSACRRPSAAPMRPACAPATLQLPTFGRVLLFHPLLQRVAATLLFFSHGSQRCAMAAWVHPATDSLWCARPSGWQSQCRSSSAMRWWMRCAGCCCVPPLLGLLISLPPLSHPCSPRR